MSERIDGEERRLRDEALAWVMRLREAAAADWEAFATWMEDPRAAAIYWELAEADADVAEALALPRPAFEPPVARPQRRWHTGALALAASLLLVVGGYAFFRPAADWQALSTSPGVIRTARLGDGSRVTLNGGTRVLVDPANPRIATLERGEAHFSVVHREAEPFVVTVGDVRLTDLGTAFSVTREGEGLRVAVAEGAVRYRRGDDIKDLAAGDVIEVGADGRARMSRVMVSGIAAWTQDRLVYDRAPLSRVAADLSRATGLSVSVSPAVADRRFSGGFSLGARDGTTIHRAARMMGVEADRAGDGWRLEGSVRTAR